MDWIHLLLSNEWIEFNSLKLYSVLDGLDGFIGGFGWMMN
jgi:hypothetical protein